ncbi:hypothetical protein AB0O76_16790 [Streptomyces sp. NPDC086554]|uniref:hypothetical protein n=1 Tax=Streptomyces sp. NPDC086554 TaxID=3154864 RepID=UPI00342E76E7
MNEYFEQRFAAAAEKRRNWGGVLLFLAGVIWVVIAYQLMVPFSDGDDEYADSRKCQSMLFYEGDAPTWAEATWDDCRDERRWPEMLGWLGLSVPLSVGGAVLYTSGTTSLRMREYTAEHRIAAAKKDATAKKDTPAKQDAPAKKG